MAKHGTEMLLSQYQNSPNLKAYIECFLSEFDEVKVAIADSIKYRRLADSFGVMVDDIAYLVGATRIIYGAASLGFFGFYSNPGAEPAGDDTVLPLEGGVLRSDADKESGDFVRTDTQLKGAIKARIIKTMTNCNIEDIIDFCDLVIGRSLKLEIKEGPLKMDFILHEKLSVSDKVLIAHMLPDIKPSGVSITLADTAGTIVLVYSSIVYPPDNL
ncbi:MAG: hypothetical protein [Caudoviricetes sp.]|nr:MAG: hypothetical protein [Caudoviricetes sp.]